MITKVVINPMKTANHCFLLNPNFLSLSSEFFFDLSLSDGIKCGINYKCKMKVYTGEEFFNTLFCLFFPFEEFV